MSAPDQRPDPPSFLRPSPRAFALMVLLVAACVLGLAPILVRLTETGPAAAGFWRFLLALPLLALLAARERGGIATPSKWALLAGLFFALDLSFWHYGIVMTSVANATVLCNLTPVVVTLFGWLVLKERPHRLFLFALALAMGGAFAMAAGADGGQGTNPRLGDAFSLSVAIWYSGYFLSVKAARATAGAMRVTFWATLLGTPLLLIVALALGEDIVPASLAGWGACLAMGVMHVFGQGGVAWALGRLPASITAVTILVQPVVAGLLGWWVFGETLTPVQALGGVLVLGAVVLAQRAQRARPTPADALSSG
ncbi:MAG: EamA family transporter [Candidatus Brevundimonas colombiensis]|uniref:EamA family transporter n=1 Tax=Candidatus Brevundimonas colombiensis TaxID=3121376 RepID=A0AAJ5X017_9CAUL|nr:EamA family transporter [Brevundimonas sp.]WEK40509.1 MAG: EamA family transporter [Brevundimonas sp.]